MSARLEELFLENEESFHIGVFQDNLEKITWHYHNHFEISFITEGTGKRIVGDSIEEFQPGDMVFLGRNLPHVWIAEPTPSTWSSRTLEMVYMQFSSTLLSPQLLSIPEFSNIKTAMNRADRGIQISGQTLNEVSEIMLQLPYLRSFDRMIQFLQLMNTIGKSKELKSLASEDYIKLRFQTEDRRITTIHHFLMSHYHEKIDLASLALLVNMAPGSLCRYFKLRMGITIFEYFHKIKVDFACRLLMDPDMSVLRVCLESGFNNLSHFNKQFKKITGMPPGDYRKKIMAVH